MSLESIALSFLKTISCLLKAMPHGSDKSPAKNRNEIHHSLCISYGSDNKENVMT